MTGRRKLLIVEDTEPAGVTLEMALLSIADLDVMLLGSAEEALGVLESEDGVCALVTDLNMPRMDGFELIERIRAGGRYARLPIVVISGDTHPCTPQRMRHLGVDAFFPKPYSPAQVRRKVEQLLNAYKRPQAVPIR